MASRISASDLSNHSLTAVAALRILRALDRELPPTKLDDRNFSDAVLKQYYDLCLAARLIPAVEAGDPKWAENHLQEYPMLRGAALAIVSAKRALEVRVEVAEGEVSALRATVSALQTKNATLIAMYPMTVPSPTAFAPAGVPAVGARAYSAIPGPGIVPGAPGHVPVGSGAARSTHGVVPGGIHR